MNLKMSSCLGVTVFMGVVLLWAGVAGDGQRLVGRDGGRLWGGDGHVLQRCASFGEDGCRPGRQFGQARLGLGDLRFDQLPVGLGELLLADVPKDIQQPEDDIFQGRGLLGPADPFRPGRYDRCFEAQIVGQFREASRFDVL